jgi:alpha-L-rhamnosidase
MLDALKATIVTEAWDPALKSNMTLSHAWASAPANAVARHILGVQVSEPGAAAFRIRPRTGSLTEVEGTVPSLRGPVSVQVRRSADTHTTLVTLPPNSRAVLEVEIGDSSPKAYRVKAASPRGEGSAKVESFTDLTGTVLRIGLIGSGTTEVRRKSS